MRGGHRGLRLAGHPDGNLQAGGRRFEPGTLHLSEQLEQAVHAPSASRSARSTQRPSRRAGDDVTVDTGQVEIQKILHARWLVRTPRETCPNSRERRCGLPARARDHVTCRSARTPTRQPFKPFVALELKAALRPPGCVRRPTVEPPTSWVATSTHLRSRTPRLRPVHRWIESPLEVAATRYPPLRAQSSLWGLVAG